MNFYFSADTDLKQQNTKGFHVFIYYIRVGKLHLFFFCLVKQFIPFIYKKERKIERDLILASQCDNLSSRNE